MARTIGFLIATTPGIWREYINAFKTRLNQLGPVGGEPVRVIEDKWASGNADAYERIAKEFDQMGVDAIVTSGTEPVIRAVKGAPNKHIFFAAAGGPFDPPLPAHVVGTLNEQNDRPLANQRFNKLKQIFRPEGGGGANPKVAVLGNFRVPNAKAEAEHIYGNAGHGGAGHDNQIDVLPPIDIKDPAEIKGKIEGLGQDVALLYVCTDPMITTHQGVIIATANARKLPTMFAFKEYVEHGGLLSLGPSFTEMFEKAADNVHAYLRQLPLHGFQGNILPAQYKLVINTITELQIGVRIPQGVKNQAENWP